MVSNNDEIVSEVASAEVQAALPAEVKSISEEEFEKAQKTFQLGKKNLFLNKFDESVTNIGDACKIYSNKFGEFDPQCAEVYFFYGRALLELARVENTVLGNALTGVPEDNEPINDSRYGNPEDIPAEEKDDITEKVIDALCDREEQIADKPVEELTKSEEINNKETPITTTPIETAETVVKQAETITTSTTEETKVVEEVTKNGVEETAVVTEKTEEKKEGEELEVDEEDEDDEDEEDDEDLTKAKDEAEADDISNLQRSWEMFELAKLVYSKNYDNDVTFRNKRIAECLLKLGEISIEQEIYEQAITDISESIRLQEEAPQAERDERMLAESFYQLGLAQQFNNVFTEANESYQKSINIMQLRVEKLKGKMELCANDADGELEKNSIKEEIGELEALLPEMTAKLEEVNEQGQQSLTLIKEAKECFISSIAETGKLNGAPVIANGEVKDITSIIKSKRKITEDGEDVNSKKTRLSEGNEKEETTTEVLTNGHNHTNGDSHVSENVEMTNVTAETNGIETGPKETPIEASN